jgi:hypothetical protein
VTATVQAVDRRAAPSGVASPAPFTKRFRHGWLLEAGAGAVIFLTYDFFRDHVVGTGAAALRNAKQVVEIERFVGLYQERAIQQAFLSVDWFMAFWNIYYGTIHFVMPVVALVWLYRKAPARYVRWRNTLVFMLGISIVAFWLYPLMPPRLMPTHYDFVDGASRFFNFGPQVHVAMGPNGEPTRAALSAFGNLFAAMPSLHVGWSTWSVLALWPVVQRRWVRVLLALYPISILFCIVVTANHWILDAAGGWAVLGLAYACAVGVERIHGAASTVPRN